MKTLILPDGVADSWFLVCAGGEVYSSRVCRGSDLIRALAWMCYGNEDEENEDLDRYAEQLADWDTWFRCGTADRFTGCNLPCGEDGDIEVHLIDDDRAIAALNK